MQSSKVILDFICLKEMEESDETDIWKALHSLSLNLSLKSKSWPKYFIHMYS